MKRILFWVKSKTYQSKVLFLVTTISGISVLASVCVFYVGDLYHRDSDTKRDVNVSAGLLADLIKLPLYAGDLVMVKNLAQQTIYAFGLSKVVISSPDGREVLIEPHEGVNKGGFHQSVPVTLNDSLSPETAIFGQTNNIQSPVKTIGVVTVYSIGKERYETSMKTVSFMIGAGLFLWGLVSYFGHLLTRKTSIMFDRLVHGISKIEAGEARFVDVDQLEDGANRIAEKINDMSRSLYAREEENIELHKKIAEQMEGRAQRAEQIMHSKLLQANKMSSLGLLVSSIAHEINNPNAMIRLQLESASSIVKDGLPILEKLAEEEGEFYLGGLPFFTSKNTLIENLSGIHEQSIRINDVVQGLRDYVSGKQGGKQDVSVELIVTRSLNLLQSQIKRGKCIIEQYLEDGVIIYANQFNIESVIINLLQNAFRAVKSMDSDGVVAISSHRGDSEITISVTDNGTGISEEDLPLLCDPFFSRHLEEGGTGLGLFISKGILDDHNGNIEFLSEIGVGTTVLLRFPYGGI